MIKDTNYLTYFDITQSWDIFAVIFDQKWHKYHGCYGVRFPKTQYFEKKWTILMGDFYQNAFLIEKNSSILFRKKWSFWFQNGRFWFENGQFPIHKWPFSPPEMAAATTLVILFNLKRVFLS